MQYCNPCCRGEKFFAPTLGSAPQEATTIKSDGDIMSISKHTQISMMGQTSGLLLKLLGGTLALSLGIKYLAPALAIAPSEGNAIAMITVPPLLLAIILGIRAWQYSPHREDQP